MKKQEHTRSSTGSNNDLYSKVTDAMRKKFCLREFYFSIYHIFRIAIGITIVVLICETKLEIVTKNFSYQRTQEILELWSKNVIVDMITVSTYNCPEGYEMYSSAQWMGTKQGCLCVAQLGVYDYIHVLPGQCTPKLIDVGCTKVNPQNSIPFAFWKPNQLICVKRLDGLNFYTNLSKFLNANLLQNCAEGETYQMESLSIQYCPITSISNKSSTYQFSLSNINFSFARESWYPIIDIKLTQYQFCLQYNRSNISPGRFNNYNLQPVQISNCQQANDPRVTQIDQQTQLQLFKNNPRIYDVVTNKLPVYPVPTNRYVYKLGGVSYPPWTYECRQSEQHNLKTTYDILSFNDTIYRSQICVYLTIMMVVIWSFLYSLAKIIQKIVQIRNRHKYGILFYPDDVVAQISPNLLSNSLKLSLSCQVIIFGFILATGIGILIELGVQYQYVNQIENWLRSSFKCMDNATYFIQWVQDGYLNVLQPAVRKYLICILAGLIVIFFDFIFLIWRFNRGDLQGKSGKNIFSDREQKNSDERISEDRPNPNDDVIKEKQLDEYEDDLKKPGARDIELQTIDPQNSLQREENLISGRKFGKIHRRSVMAMTRAIKDPNNPTEESLANFRQDDDLEFGKGIESPTSKKQKKKNLGKSKHRTLSLDFQE